MKNIEQRAKNNIFEFLSSTMVFFEPKKLIIKTPVKIRVKRWLRDPKDPKEINDNKTKLAKKNSFETIEID